MSMPLTPDTYASLVEENKKWLMDSTNDCLERQHIIAIMDDAVRQYSMNDIRRELREK